MQMLGRSYIIGAPLESAFSSVAPKELPPGSNAGHNVEGLSSFGRHSTDAYMSAISIVYLPKLLFSTGCRPACSAGIDFNHTPIFQWLYGVRNFTMKLLNSSIFHVKVPATENNCYHVSYTSSQNTHMENIRRLDLKVSEILLST